MNASNSPEDAAYKMLENTLEYLTGMNKGFLVNPDIFGSNTTVRVVEKFIAAYDKHWQFMYDANELEFKTALEEFMNKHHHFSIINMPHGSEVLGMINIDVNENFLGLTISDQIIEELAKSLYNSILYYSIKYPGIKYKEFNPLNLTYNF